MTADFSHGAAGKAADAGVHFGDAGGDEVEDVAVAIVEGGENASAEIGLDLGAEVGKGGSGRHGHYINGGAILSFAFYSPIRDLGLLKGACQGYEFELSAQNENVRFVQSRNVRFHGWPRAPWRRSESL